jgi:hypothetical protein
VGSPRGSPMEAVVLLGSPCGSSGGFLEDVPRRKSHRGGPVKGESWKGSLEDSSGGGPV